MAIFLKTDGKKNNISASTDRIIFSVETENVKYFGKIKYEFFKNANDVSIGVPFIVRESGRYLYLDGDLFADGKEYFWRVILSTPNGEVFSDVARFEKGINQSGFKAKWIENPKFDGRVSEFIKKFEVHGKITRARLYIVGLGFSESYINGIKTDDCYFKPALTDFDKRVGLNNPHYNEENFGKSKKTVLYDVFDVKELLKEGENEIMILLGTGWYCNEDKNITDPSYSYGNPKLFFELRVGTEKGEYRIFSDEECFVRNTDIKSQMFAGDYMDFTAVKEPYAKAALVASPTGKLLPNITDNDKVLEEISPLNERKIGNAVLYDFGKNHTGCLRLLVKGEKGGRLTIRYYENLKNGKPDPISSRWYAYKDGIDIIGYIDQKSEYVLSGNTDEIKPYFHWNCYRYATIEADCEYSVLALESLFIAAETQIDGSFTCSDETLNKLHDAFILTQKDNMHCGVPSDCPTREKLPYTGDGQLVSEAVLYSFTAERFYRKWLKDIIDSQGENGFIAYTAPVIAGGGGFWWSDALVVIPFILYNFTGDKQILKDAYAPCKKLIGFYENNHNGDYVMRKSYLKWFLGDWCAPDDAVADVEYINTLAAQFAVKQVIKMCDILGEEKDKKRFVALEEKFNKAINENFFDIENEEYAGGGHGANILPALNGIADDKTARKLIGKIAKKYESDAHFDVGIVLISALLDVLTAADRDDVALKLLTEKTAPSFYDMLEGETTLKESWRDSEEYGKTVSRCHPMFGSVLRWIYQNVAGLNLSRLCDGKIIYAPRLFDKIKRAAASKKTPYGLAEINYVVDNGFNMRLNVPYGVEAEILIKTDVNNIRFSNGEYIKAEKSGAFYRFYLKGGEYTVIGDM